MSQESRPVWRPFVRASLGVAAIAGFGLGAGLFLALALDDSIGLWWPAAVQAHGHAQLFGWAGLMVLGVGFHFLPRLLGATLHQPERTRLVLALLLSGLVLRTMAQPGLALIDSDPFERILRVGLATSGLLELAGASLALWLLVMTLRRGPDVRKRSEMRAVFPFFLTAFAGFWLALGVNALGLLEAARSNQALVTPATDRLTIQLVFHLFLIPVSVAMSSRTFPLYFRTPPPKSRLLRVGLALSMTGLLFRVSGERRAVESLAGLGQLLQGVALVIFILALGVYARRLPLPRRPVRPLTDPIQLHALTAYGWLLFTGVLLLLSGVDALGVPSWRNPADAEWHALGAGFVTLLILGVGAHLLPGFARRPLRSMRLVWVTLFLGNAAALLRIGPLLLEEVLSPTMSRALMGTAGIAALTALALIAINLTGARVSRPSDRKALQLS